jgi:hypothetical protein
MISNQWLRKVGLFVFSDKNAIDLSDFHIRFEVCNGDYASPNNCAIRIYNLSKDTITKLTKNSEYKSITLNAGYESGNYGVIFSGTIKQFRIGKESNIDSYLDILSADGDAAYNQSFMNQTFAKGYTQKDVIDAAAKSMGLPVDYGGLKQDAQHRVVPNPRGKVSFGMSRAFMRNAATVLDSSWSIQNGKIQVTSNKGYLDNDVVKINSQTGMIGIPEQTDEGIRVKCLLNSRLRIGNLVEIDNSAINVLQQADPNSPTVPYDSNYGQIQNLAPLSDDGTYRIFVVEHEGDNRGQQWYSNLVGLAIDRTSKTVLAK